MLWIAMPNRRPVRPIPHNSATDWIAHAIGTVGFSGHLPGAPGTWGTFATAPLYFFWLGHLPPLVYLVSLVGFYFIGAWAVSICDPLFRTHDSTDIVIDEFVGFLAGMTLVPVNVWTLAAGITLFRIYDISKPWPCRIFDRKAEGHHAVVLDDLFAGIWTFLTLHLLGYLCRAGHLPAVFWS